MSGKRRLPPAFPATTFPAPFEPLHRFPRELGWLPFWGLAIAFFVVMGSGAAGIVVLLAALVGAGALWRLGRRQAEQAAAELTGLVRSHHPDAPAIDRKALAVLLDRGRLTRSADDGTEIALRLKGRAGDDRPQLQLRYRPAGFGLAEFDDALRSLGADPQVQRAMELLRQRPRGQAAG